MFNAAFSQMVASHVVILGAGISGLALAWFLKKHHGSQVEVTLIEKSARVGGWIQTSVQEGFLFEQGPRGCRPGGTGVETLGLIQELNLEDQLIVNSEKTRYLYEGHSLRELPTSIGGLLASPWLCKILWKPFLCEWAKPRSCDRDESIYDFIARRLSPAIANTLMDPLTLGIYAGDIRQLSIKSCFPLLSQWEQESGSLLQGAFFNRQKKTALHPLIQKASLFSLRGGMEVLVNQLATQVNAKILLNTEVKALKIQQEGVVIQTSNGALHADHLFSTLPASSLASLIKPSEEAVLLESIPYRSLSVVNVGYRVLVLKKKGFGYLIPSKEKAPILGMVWDSCVFPQQNGEANETRLTVMLKDNGENDEEIRGVVGHVLKTHLQIENKPDFLAIHRKPCAIPQYLVGHSEKVKAIERHFLSLSSSLTLLGTGFYGVSVNDCIGKARAVALSWEKK